MLLEAVSLSKSAGPKDLFHDLSFTIPEGQKIALIGRNGQGKTTLLKMLSGEDTDFEGELKMRRNLRVTLTRQEHADAEGTTALAYILGSVPHYIEDEKAIEDYANGHHSDLHRYSVALERFSAHGYFHIRDTILNTLKGFQIPEERATGSLSRLSGGEKRYVELARMMYSGADLFLVDEPTNHMDYIGKEEFISWMCAEPNSVLVVTHDRDVLKRVDRIIELKDGKLYEFNGNYDRYISQNATDTSNSVKLYQDQLNRLKEAKKRVEWGLQMRAKSKEWKVRYEHWLRDYEKIKAETVKPSFWIDQESAGNLDKDVAESYGKFKEKNISIAINRSEERTSQLVTVRNLSLGYGSPLFRNISFSLRNNDRVFIKGRNGAGKSTLVKTVLSLSRGETPVAGVFGGDIILGPTLRIGQYEQEISSRYLPLPLEEAVLQAYGEYGIPMEDRQVKGLLSRYLFDPVVDGRQKIASLSGGQKARFQIMKMLAPRPNLLVLDEPTNHLDLPSIEELEKALTEFQGGILYISHDTYFIRNMGGEEVAI